MARDSIVELATLRAQNAVMREAVVKISQMKFWNYESIFGLVTEAGPVIDCAVEVLRECDEMGRKQG